MLIHTPGFGAAGHLVELSKQGGGATSHRERIPGPGTVMCAVCAQSGAPPSSPQTSCFHVLSCVPSWVTVQLGKRPGHSVGEKVCDRIRDSCLDGCLAGGVCRLATGVWVGALGVGRQGSPGQGRGSPCATGHIEGAEKTIQAQACVTVYSRSTPGISSFPRLGLTPKTRGAEVLPLREAMMQLRLPAAA